MQVLKFGGSSVANAANISKCVSIIRKAIELDKTVVVVSALGGITDNLLLCAAAAAAGDEGYLETLKGIEQRHLDTRPGTDSRNQPEQHFEHGKKNL